LVLKIDKGLEESMGFFGSEHFDKFNTESSVTVMVGAPDIDKGESGGHFHLLELNGYIPLDVPVIMLCSGLRKHGGTSPLAAPPIPGEPPKPLSKWGYCWFSILYPPACIMDGRSIISLRSLPGKDFFPMKPEIADPQ
jgi:hypothetical protein